MESKRQIDFHVGKEFADNHGMKYYESSAKNGSNVETLFLELASEIKEKTIVTPDKSNFLYFLDTF